MFARGREIRAPRRAADLNEPLGAAAHRANCLSERRALPTCLALAALGAHHVSASHTGRAAARNARHAAEIARVSSVAASVPAHTVSRPGAAPSDGRVLTTRFVDFWLLGGASLLVWLVMISLQGFLVYAHFDGYRLTPPARRAPFRSSSTTHSIFRTHPDPFPKAWLAQASCSSCTRCSTRTTGRLGHVRA